MTSLLVATLQIATILLVTLALAWMLRKRASALRHAVLAIGLACAALTPVLGVVLPRWNFPVPAMASMDSGTFAWVPVLAPDDGPAERKAVERLMPAEDSTVALANDARAGQIAMTQSGISGDAPARVRDPVTTAALIGTLYLGGVAVSIMLLLVGLIRVRRIASRAVPMNDGRWQQQLAAIAGTCGLRRTVQMKLSRHEPVLATWGLFRPQVILPGAALEWPAERIRAVLLHEIAHVRRNDWCIQLLARLLCAVYWFNPLVWITYRSLRHESERACDDAAVRAGVAETEYAAHLLALARSIARPPWLLAPMPSMARRSGLHRRVSGLLDPRAHRDPPTGAGMATVAVILSCITCLIAACDIGQRTGSEAMEAPQISSAMEPPPVIGSAADPPVETMVENASAPTEEIKAVPEQVTRVPAELPPRHVPPDLRERADQPGGPVELAGDIARHAQSLLEGGLSSQALEYEHLRGALGSVQRTAQRVRDNYRHDPVRLAAGSTALLNAMGDAAQSASNIAARPGTPEPVVQELRGLESQLRERREELAALVLPLPAVRSFVVSTPERRAAVEALDLAQVARADPMFVRPRTRTSLAAAMETLERAAQSLLSGEIGDQQGNAAKLTALATAVLQAERVATNISGRAVEPEEIRGKAKALAAGLRKVADQLDVAVPTPSEQALNEQRWQGWMLPPLRPGDESPLRLAGGRIDEFMAGRRGWSVQSPFYYSEKSTLQGAVWTDGTRKLRVYLAVSESLDMLRLEHRNLLWMRPVIPPHRDLPGVGESAVLFERGAVEITFTIERQLLHVVLELSRGDPPTGLNSPAPPEDIQMATDLARGIAEVLGP